MGTKQRKVRLPLTLSACHTAILRLDQSSKMWCEAAQENAKGWDDERQISTGLRKDLDGAAKNVTSLSNKLCAIERDNEILRGRLSDLEDQYKSLMEINNKAHAKSNNLERGIIAMISKIS